MSMTREEAIILFEKQLTAAQVVLDSGFGSNPGENDSLYRRRKEMAEIALSALRPVSREQVEKAWSPCNFCAGAKYITGGVTAVYPVSETRQQETLAEGDFDFCPVCGRPITDEAVQMVMERLEATNDKREESC